MGKSTSFNECPVIKFDPAKVKSPSLVSVCVDKECAKYHVPVDSNFCGECGKKIEIEAVSLYFGAVELLSEFELQNISNYPEDTYGEYYNEDFENWFVAREHVTSINLLKLHERKEMIDKFKENHKRLIELLVENNLEFDIYWKSFLKIG